MNNTLADYTEVHIDNTPPRFDRVEWKKNIKNGTYVHTSRIQFVASDDGSGVHLLEYKLFVGDDADEHGGGYVSANIMQLMPAQRNQSAIVYSTHVFYWNRHWT